MSILQGGCGRVHFEAMSLFLLTLIAPAMWALSNHFDKFIVSRYCKDATIGAMMIFSALIALAVLPVAYIFQEQAFSIGVVTPLVLFFKWMLISLGRAALLDGSPQE